jgi:uncharacterized protein (TIGR00255 family)
MTGYGRGECTMFDRKFVVEIKSVNHRYNDITIKLPRIMMSYEDGVKKLLASQIFRGKTDVYINFESFSKEDVSISINEGVADSYVAALKVLEEKYNLYSNEEGKLPLELVAKFPDVVSVENGVLSDEAKEEIRQCLMSATAQALEAFTSMRTREGEALKANISEKLVGIKSAVDKINERAPEVAKDYRQRLTEKLNELEEVKADEARILTEVLIFSDKACIDEEITRLYSHLDQMASILEEKVPVGRKLDFLVQEINREVNTIGSKSNDLTITNLIVDTKSEVEKIREQIQNIE